MAIGNARPTIWSAKILRALNTLLVYGGPNVINRDYEGEVAEAGDTVKITTVGDVKVSAYSKDTDIAGAEALVDGSLTLSINQQDYFNFAIDNIDRRQSAVNLMEEATRRAAYALRKKTDEYIAGLYTDAGAEITGVKYSISEKESPVYKGIVEAGYKLDESDTPDDGTRFIILPPIAIGSLQQDLRFVAYGTPDNRRTLEKGLGQGGSTSAGFGYANGLVGEVAGFKVYQSNNVPVASSKYKVLAGHPMAWSFVDNLSKVVAYEPPLRFAEAVKGLHVYGAKVVRPSQLVKLIVES